MRYETPTIASCGLAGALVTGVPHSKNGGSCNDSGDTGNSTSGAYAVDE